MPSNFDVERLAVSSRRAAFASVVGVVIVVASLLYSGHTLSDLQKERRRLQSDVDSLSVQNTALRDSIRVKQDLLDLTMGLSSHRHEIDWREAKMLATGPNTFKLTFNLLDLRNRGVSWKLGGTTPEEGFDSPGFAAFVLSRVGTSPPITLAMRHDLRERVPTTDAPHVGDLIFYDGGYTMFYLRDTQGHPFCIGMTPAGIVALDIDFGPRVLAYGRIDYR